MISEVFNEDCMIGMARYPDKYFDLAVVDPPYGIGQPKQSNLKGYNGRKSLDERIVKNRLNTGAGKLKDRILNQSNVTWDNAIPDDNYFLELQRISKIQIIWGGNYFPLPPTRCVIVWDKMQPWENFSQVEIAWTSFDSPARLFKYDNRTGGKIHPTQKPVALYSWIYHNYLKDGGKVIDTHDQLYTAIEQGMNIEKLLLATGLDVETFNMNMENNEWNHEQVKAIRNTIKDWEDGK